MREIENPLDPVPPVPNIRTDSLFVVSVDPKDSLPEFNICARDRGNHHHNDGQVCGVV